MRKKSTKKKTSKTKTTWAERFSSTINTMFAKHPFFPKGFIECTFVREDEVTLSIGPRDVTIRKDGTYAGCGTVMHYPLKIIQ